MRRFLVIATMLLSGVRAAVAPPDPAGTIQTAELNPARPYFLPTHPRVTTTVRFPGEVGPPEGAVPVFTEDAARQPAEYLVNWQSGDAYFTLTPLRDAQMANLNVPYQGNTYVVYVYPVADPLQAVAVLNLAQGPRSSAAASEVPVPASRIVTREASPPPETAVVATPARLVGMLDRLKLIHATPPGPALASLVKAMNVQVATSRETFPLPQQKDSAASSQGVTGECGGGMNDAGLFQVLLLRAVRDPRINCIGFVCLIRNTSDRTLVFDVTSFGARAGVEYLAQRISDATPLLNPGEQAPAYFVVQPPQSRPLLATNPWRITVDLISPRLNPGAAITRGYTRAEEER